jgi:hypothetical protein
MPAGLTSPRRRTEIQTDGVGSQTFPSVVFAAFFRLEPRNARLTMTGIRRPERLLAIWLLFLIKDANYMRTVLKPCCGSACCGRTRRSMDGWFHGC